MENGVSALIEVVNNTDQSSSQDVIDLEKHSSPDDNMDIDAQQLILKTSPEVFALLCFNTRSSYVYLEPFNLSIF